MSAPTELVDPQLTAFWASDPSILPETEQPDPVPAHRKHLALEIAAAFLVCARLVRIALAAHHDVTNPGKAADEAWGAVLPLFVGLAASALGDSLRLDPATAEVSITSLRKITGDYAAGLGRYLGTSSVDAFIKGVDRQLVGRWTERVAWARAAAGFGLDERAYTAYLARTAVSVVDNELVAPAAKAVADAALLVRAQLIGESEAQTSAEVAKVLHWQQLQAEGLISATAKRRWTTARFEDDCALCGALDRQEVLLDEPFVVDGYEIWSPQAHPNCKCHLELVDDIIKADWDPKRHPRGHVGNAGQFADVAERDPAVDEMMAQARALQAEEIKSGTPSVFAEPDNPFGGPSKVDPFAGSPFAGPPRASTDFGPTASADFGAKASSDFGAKASTDFGATASADFAPRAPATRLRIIRRNTVLMPPPIAPQVSYPYYLPADLYHAQVNEHDMGNPLGLHEQIDFTPPSRIGQLVATATTTPWQTLDWDTRAFDRIDRYFNPETRTYEPRATPGEIREWWAKMVPDAFTAWNLACAGANGLDGLSYVDDLEPEDREQIADLAGFRDYGGDLDLSEKIKAAVAKMGTGDNSLACAYADYVTYQRPQVLGAAGDDLRFWLDQGNELGVDLTARPVDQVLTFRSGFHPGTRVGKREADPRGKFMVGRLTYRSALHDMGSSAPPLMLGLQEAYVQPYVQRTEPFIHRAAAKPAWDGRVNENAPDWVKQAHRDAQGRHE